MDTDEEWITPEEEFKNADLTTAELCMAAVKKWGVALEYVPEEFKTWELCKEAVRNCAPALWYVPERFKTVDFCMEAIDQNMDWEYADDLLDYSLEALPEAVREEVLKQIKERKV